MTKDRANTVHLKKSIGLSWFLWPIPALLAFLAQRLLAGRPELVEKYHSRMLFRWISRPLGIATSAVPFSLTEFLAVIGSLFFLILLIIWLVRLFRQTNRLLKFGILLRRLAWVASFAYLVFMLLHGLNYARLPVAQSFELPVRERGSAELKETAIWLADQASELRKTRQQDSSGVFRLRLGIAESLSAASDGYANAAKTFPLMDGPDIRPKSVILSHYWSYTGIGGMYFPFFVESNINTDMPDYQIPATELHEIAHTRGFAREDEAGFIGFLAGVYHPNADFAYSAILDAAVSCLNQLGGIDPDLYKQAASHLSAEVWLDLKAGSTYWKQFEGPVQNASNRINNAYLQSNLQKDGVRSYGRMVDLVLAWYEKQKADGKLDEAIFSMNLESADTTDK
jgi:hypothetical protein